MSNNKNGLTLKQVVKQQYTKCAADPEYFIIKYCKIAHPVKGKIPFILYDFQRDVLEDLQENDYNIILKARQLGMSTLAACYILWLILFHENKSVLVLATSKDTAKNMVTKVKMAHDNLPTWLRGNLVEDNKLSMRFSNGSEVKALSSKAHSARSESLSLLVLDEAAFIDRIDEIWTASQQTLATGGRCLIISTPNGVGNFFHRTWVEAIEGRNGFNPIKLHWSVHPNRDQEWRDEQDKLLSKKKAAQECDTSFITSGETVVDGEIIQWYKDRFQEDPIEKRLQMGNYWIWKYPQASKSYIVSADVARGDGSDFSAFQVLDVETIEQVAEYKGQLGTKEFGNLLISVATEYNGALLIVENSNIGWATIQQIIDQNYPNLFYMSNDLKYVEVERQLTNKLYTQDKNLVPGFTTSTKTRPLIVSKMDRYIRETYDSMEDKRSVFDPVIIRSERLIDELFTFIWTGKTNKKAEAMRGYNDDLVMSYAIGVWVRDTALRLRQEGIELTKNSLEGIERTYEDYDNVYSPKNMESDPYKIKFRDDEEDLRWLL